MERKHYVLIFENVFQQLSVIQVEGTEEEMQRAVTELMKEDVVYRCFVTELHSIVTKEPREENV